MNEPASTARPRRSRLAASGALLAACAVALSAYAAHAVQGADQARLHTAAFFAFGHGVALAALAPAASRGPARFGLVLLFLGVLLFSGSLAFKAIMQWPTTLAPMGGMLLIAGWALYAVDAMRR